MKLEILLALVFSFYQPKIPPLPVIHHDPRLAALATFMRVHNFAPIQLTYVKDYIACADRFQTDWRLLPSIALAESSGGKRYPIRTNNFLGWNSANYSFQSKTDALCFVSEKLANGQYYRGKSTQAKLNAYNPNPQYAKTVMRYMNEINSR